MIAWADYKPGNYRAMCPVCGRRPNDKTLGITVMDNEHGIGHCFRCGFVETRRVARDMSPEERNLIARRMQALHRHHFIERQRQQADSAAAAAIRWAAAVPAGEHRYLTDKCVAGHGLRVDSGILLVPVRDAAGTLHSLQSIEVDGTKRFLPGGRVKGCYHAIGRASRRLCVCEGYATGATIHEDTGDAVAVAFNANNLLPVALVLRAKLPDITIVIAADDDWKTDGNPGLTAATAAARAVGGLLAVPNFDGLPRGDRDTDFNDLHRLASMGVVA